MEDLFYGTKTHNRSCILYYVQQRVRQADPWLYKWVKAFINVVTSDISFNGNMEIDLGGITAELHHIPSPHSDDSVCIFVPQERVLFIGDAVGVDYYINCYLDKDKLRSLIDAIEGFDFDTCVVGHAEPISKQSIVNIMNSLMER
ncbi:MBL fold metallo-hydrolase [Paenibacillus motobuensis]|uniref:Metallo-beta-lactamase domain-containing protein n=1 Tax=Paenibacillus motobuensis TaxID=295324 RepID=A0ABP3HXH4_9BACL